MHRGKMVLSPVTASRFVGAQPLLRPLWARLPFWPFGLALKKSLSQFF